MALLVPLLKHACPTSETQVTNTRAHPSPMRLYAAILVFLAPKIPFATMPITPVILQMAAVHWP